MNKMRMIALGMIALVLVGTLALSSVAQDTSKDKRKQTKKELKEKASKTARQAALKLLEDDLITRHEKVYSIADPLLSLWMDRKEL